jgi:hypothetical protein
MLLWDAMAIEGLVINGMAALFIAMFLVMVSRG